MSEGGNPFGALVAFWIFMQVVWTLVLLGGGIYVLWCLNRIASSVERLADQKVGPEVTPLPGQPIAAPQPFVPAGAPLNTSVNAPVGTPLATAAPAPVSTPSTAVESGVPQTEAPPLSLDPSVGSGYYGGSASTTPGGQ